MRERIVIISGKQGSGKTSLANELVSRFFNKRDGFATYQLNFADTIYKMHDRCLDVLKECNFPTPKKDGNLLQLLGTEWGRNTLGPNIWVELLKGRINRFRKFEVDQGFRHTMLVVVADCRFENEFDAFPNALKVRLECPEEVRKARILATPGQMWRENTNHPSEVGLDAYAAAGKFDIYLNTYDTSLEGCANSVELGLKKRAK